MENASGKAGVTELLEFARAEGWSTKNPIFENESFIRVLLEGNKMSLKRSKAALQQTYAWRQKHCLDTAKYEDFSPQFEYDIAFLMGLKTRSGAPCFYVHAKLSRYQRIFHKFGYDKYVQFLGVKMKQVERELFESIGNGSSFSINSDVVPIIVDGTGYTLSDARSVKDLWAVMNAVREACSHFPMCASGTLIVIGVNRWLEIPMKIVKPFFEAGGFQVVIHGTNEDTWLNYMDELIGVEQLRCFQSTAVEYERQSRQF